MPNEAVPNHIAIIPDGNRRWARQNGFLPWKGHERGVERFREVSGAAFEQGTRYVTLWAASESNLKERSREEVAMLVMLLSREIGRMLDSEEFAWDKTRVRVIGNWNAILKDEKLAHLVAALEEKTRSFSARNLTILFGYDGTSEMLEAIRALRGASEQITADAVHRALATRDLPPVDLVIRTGGEPHWSAGFMMWHTANSQFYFTERFWPEFGADALAEAFREYARRERRFGK